MHGSHGGGSRGHYSALPDAKSLTGKKEAEAEHEMSTSEYMYELLSVLKPYFWPDAGSDGACINRLRSSSTWLLVLLSKLCSLAAPLYISIATNELVAGSYRGCVRNLVLYSSLRFCSAFFKELQSLVYLKVKQQAYIQLSERSFRHLHSLSLSWHLNKKMGNVIRSMDRGTSAANQLVTYLFLMLVPALLECLAVCIIFLLHFHEWLLSVVVLLGVIMYIVTTVGITAWRKKFREETNKHDNDFHEKATDSMVNFETVKYFTAERFEVSRFKESVSEYQRFSVSTQGSLGLLNIMQALIINSTCLLGMMVAANAVIHDRMTLGGFVAVNAYTMAVFAPLGFLGTIYGMVVQGLIDIQNLMRLLSESPDVADAPNSGPIPILTDYYGPDKSADNGLPAEDGGKGKGKGVTSTTLATRDPASVVLRCGNCRTELQKHWLFCPFCNTTADRATKTSRFVAPITGGGGGDGEDNEDGVVEMSLLGRNDGLAPEASVMVSEASSSAASFHDIELGGAAAAAAARSRAGVGVDIDFKGVSFHYDEQASGKGLKGVTFHVPAGTTTAIVGSTGAGKTTLSRLLFRFYDPHTGSVEFNGMDIREYTQKSVRACVGVVPQDTVLFNDSIYYNVRYGRMDATREEVEAACRAASILDFIEGLPEGWETVVGERGLKLSGGEKQRVAIARCLLKDPPIVLFDEATSALDTVTEKLIQDALSALGRNRTVMVIAHRLSTVRHAQQILVLDAGQVVERGTHEQLLEIPDGHYQSLWNMQLRSTADGEVVSGAGSAAATPDLMFSGTPEPAQGSGGSAKGGNGGGEGRTHYHAHNHMHGHGH